MKKKNYLQPIPITITGRHLNITPALRDYALEKLSRLQKYFDRLMEVHIIVSTEKHQQVAEINISANGFSISGKGKTPDVFASVDEVVNKLERQLKKHREKFLERKRVASKSKRKEKEKNLPLLEDIDDDMEETDTEPEIVKIERVSQKPMSPEEAVMQMNLMKKTFLVFINSTTDGLNVIYRRPDGQYTLITP